MDTEYVVYAHKHPEVKEYVYIGCGAPGRMFCTKRMPDHMIWLEDMLGQYMLKDLVVSLGVFKTKKEALAEELKLIKQHKPKFNRAGVMPGVMTGHSPSETTKQKRSISMKKYLKENGMHWKDKISKSLKGKPWSDKRVAAYKGEKS